jgi:putative phage-type endonuclease
MQLIDLEQGTPEWLAWRSQGIGGSDAPVIMGCSPYGTVQSLWEEKLGLRQRPPTNPGQLRGHELEPHARAALEEHLGISLEPACGQHDTLDFLRASFDGLSFDGSIVAEAKAPNVLDHTTALAGKIPSKYWPQAMHLLSIADSAEKGYYVSYRPGEPAAILAFFRDADYIARLQAAEVRFWEAIVTRTLPQDVALRSAAIAYRLLLEEVSALQAFEGELRAELIRHVPAGGKRVEAEGVLVSLRPSDGALDLEKVVAAYGASKDVVEACRKLGAIDDRKAIKAFGKDAVDKVRRAGAVDEAKLAVALKTTLDELDKFRAPGEVTASIRIRDDAGPVGSDLMNASEASPDDVVEEEYVSVF